jgi:hypothetical protein
MQRAEAHVAAVGKYPLLGSPDASQREALALAEVLDGLPAGEVPPLLDLLQSMALPWKKLAEAIPRLAAMTTTQRQAIYALAQAETQRERSRAITLVTDSGPSPDPQLGRVQDMRSWLAKARGQAAWCVKHYPDDPWSHDLRAYVPALQAFEDGLRTLEQTIQEATRRAYDAALSEASGTVAANSGRGETARAL